MSKTGIKYRLSPKKRPERISPEARRLIRGVLRKCKGNESEASRILRLPVRSQLGRMLRGEMGETPQMRAAVLRARARAERAFLMERPTLPEVDLERARKLLADARWVIDVLENMLI